MAEKKNSPVKNKFECPFKFVKTISSCIPSFFFSFSSFSKSLSVWFENIHPMLDEAIAELTHLTRYVGAVDLSI